MQNYLYFILLQVILMLVDLGHFTTNGFSGFTAQSDNDESLLSILVNHREKSAMNFAMNVESISRNSAMPNSTQQSNPSHLHFMKSKTVLQLQVLHNSSSNLFMESQEVIDGTHLKDSSINAMNTLKKNTNHSHVTHKERLNNRRSKRQSYGNIDCEPFAVVKPDTQREIIVFPEKTGTLFVYATSNFHSIRVTVNLQKNSQTKTFYSNDLCIEDKMWCRLDFEVRHFLRLRWTLKITGPCNNEWKSTYSWFRKYQSMKVEAIGESYWRWSRPDESCHLPELSPNSTLSPTKPPLHPSVLPSTSSSYEIRNSIIAITVLLAFALIVAFVIFVWKHKCVRKKPASWVSEFRRISPEVRQASTIGDAEQENGHPQIRPRMPTPTVEQGPTTYGHFTITDEISMPRNRWLPPFPETEDLEARAASGAREGELPIGETAGRRDPPCIEFNQNTRCDIKPSEAVAALSQSASLTAMNDKVKSISLQVIHVVNYDTAKETPAFVHDDQSSSSESLPINDSPNGHQNGGDMSKIRNKWPEQFEPMRVIDKASFHHPHTSDEIKLNRDEDNSRKNNCVLRKDTSDYYQRDEIYDTLKFINNTVNSLQLGHK